MNPFDELLGSVLTTLNQGYKEAKADLELIAQNLQDAVTKHSGFQMEIGFSQVKELVSYSIWRMYLDPNPAGRDPTTTIDYFLITAKGYPIARGLYDRVVEEFTEVEQFANSDELHAHFVQLFGEPDSRLVQAIGFAIRQRTRIS